MAQQPAPTDAVATRSSSPSAAMASTARQPAGAVFRRAFSVTDILLRVLGLMALSDGTISWSAVYRKPLAFYLGIAGVNARWFEGTTGIHVSESFAIYLPIAAIFFVGLNIGFRRVHGHSFFWNVLVVAPRAVADKLGAIGQSRVILRALLSLWGMLVMSFCFLAGPLAVLALAGGIIFTYVVVSVLVLIMSAMFVSVGIHMFVLVMVIYIFMLSGSFVGLVSLDQDLRASLRQSRDLIWQGYTKDIGGFMLLTWSGAKDAWQHLFKSAWLAIIEGPWESARSGLLRSQYSVALTVLLVLVLLSSSDILLRMLGIP